MLSSARQPCGEFGDDRADRLGGVARLGGGAHQTRADDHAVGARVGGRFSDAGA